MEPNLWSVKCPNQWSLKKVKQCEKSVRKWWDFVDRLKGATAKILHCYIYLWQKQMWFEQRCKKSYFSTSSKLSQPKNSETKLKQPEIWRLIRFPKNYFWSFRAFLKIQQSLKPRWATPVIYLYLYQASQFPVPYSILKWMILEE